MRNVVRRTGVIGGALVCLTATGYAQSPGTGTADATDSVTRLVMDSVALAAPHFDRYDRPDQCAFHAVLAENQFWRDRRADTVSLPSTGQSRQRATVAAVDACIARFAMARVADDDLLGLGRAYLAAEQVVRADSTFALLAQRTAVPGRAWVLYQIVTAYLDAAPSLLGRAEQALKHLDARGPAAAPERMLASLALARVARVRDSVALQTRALAAAKAASDALMGDAKSMYAATSADVYIALAHLHARRGNAAAAAAAIATAQHTVVPLRPMRTKRRVENAAKFFPLLGKPAPPIQARQWYGSDGSVARPPAAGRGRPALIVFAWPGSQAYPSYAVVRRLAAAFGDGLDIVFVARTTGVFQDRLVSPDSETVLLKQYYLETQHLPVTLAVSHTQYHRIADGRLRPVSLVNWDTYSVPAVRGLAAYVVAPDRTVRFVTALTSDAEAELRHVIQSLTVQSRTVQSRTGG
jgi:hypothetical protein